MISTLARQTGELVTDGAPVWWHWHGQRVRLADGATLTLADTAENQAKYPQPTRQKPGLGFPICRLVVLMCLATGALLDGAVGPCVGKGSDEQSLLRTLLDTLLRGEILIADAFYATYFLLCELGSRGVDGVFEQYGARKRSTDFPLGQWLGVRDHLIVLSKPKRPDWMSQEDYDQAPDTLTVREFQAGGKIMVTTLLCPKAVPKYTLKVLYRSRWNVEIYQSWCLHTIEVTTWGHWRRHRCRRDDAVSNSAAHRVGHAGARARRRRPIRAIGDVRRA